MFNFLEPVSDYKKKPGIIIITHHLTTKVFIYPALNIEATWNKIYHELISGLFTTSLGLAKLYEYGVNPTDYCKKMYGTQVNYFTVQFISVELNAQEDNMRTLVNKWHSLSSNYRTSQRLLQDPYCNHHLLDKFLFTPNDNIVHKAQFYPFYVFEHYLPNARMVNFENLAGIYSITLQSPLGSFIYIGRSKFISQRWSYHLYSILKEESKSANKHLLNAHKNWLSEDKVPYSLYFKIEMITDHINLNSLETTFASRVHPEILISSYK